MTFANPRPQNCIYFISIFLWKWALHTSSKRGRDQEILVRISPHPVSEIRAFRRKLIGMTVKFHSFQGVRNFFYECFRCIFLVLGEVPGVRVFRSLNLILRHCKTPMEQQHSLLENISDPRHSPNPCTLRRFFLQKNTNNKQ